MRLSDLISMGLKNLWRRRLRSILTIIAVLIGSTAVVAMLILAFGVRDVFVAQLEATGMLNRISIMSDKDAEVDFFGGGSVESEDGTKLTEELVMKFESYDDVLAVTPVIYPHVFDAMKIEGGEKAYRADVVGIRPDPAFDLNLTAGRNLTSDEGDVGKIILGYSYLENFGFKNPEDVIGKNVIFSMWEGYHNIDMELPPQNSPEEVWQERQKITAEIVGVTSPGPNERESVITVYWARRLRTEQYYGPSSEEEQQRVEELNRELGEEAGRRGREIADDEWFQPEPSIEIRDDIEENGYDTIYVQAASADDVEALAERIESENDVGAVTAQEFLDQIMNVFTVVTVVLASIAGIALLVAAVGIVNTMVMAVMERTKEIGVMKAVGASKGNIWRIFTFEAALLGFWGGVAGIALGYGITLIANYFVNNQLSGEGLAATNVAQLEWWLVFSVIGFTTLIGVIAGLYPAARAARLNPVDALRRE